MSVSPAMQEYLAEAYRIAHYQDADAFVSTSALAAVLHVSAPAVTRMVQRLKEAGYLEHEPYHGIKLTESGELEALLNIRRHRLVERFLVDIMEFGWHEVHEAADAMGATVSDKLVNRMDEMTDFPRRCPHGEPIPFKDGGMPKIVDYPLTDVEVDASYMLSRVHTHDEAILEYLSNQGLVPGTAFHVVDRAPFNGPLQVKIDDKTSFLGNELAGVLRVCTKAEYDLV
ncbi:MAG: metal-dependent transcriptional regulator [Aggregatilineales bacterium]